MVFGGAFIIVREYFQSWKPYRQQSVWAVVGAIVPIVFNIVYVFHLIPGFRKDYSSVSYALSGLAFSMAILRYQLFDLMPVARKTLVDEMSDGVLVVDRRNRVVDMNPAAQFALGLSVGEAIAQPAAQVLRFWQTLADSLSDKAEAQAEISMGQDKAQRYYDVRLSPLSDEGGRLTGQLVVLHDITARREMEEVLRRANQELEARNEELDAFGHMVAHDLKGPLTLIIGHAMLLADRNPVPEEQRDESIRSIAEIGKKMDSIIEELMLLAGLRRAQVELQPLDVADIAAKAAHRLSRMIDQYQAVIDWPTASSWPWALGYGPWVEEVWVNYLSNAIKYGGRPPRVQMGAATQNNLVRFWVRDNGPGLLPDEQARLFVPFERLGQVRITGHGLGLSVARRIMEKMGGQVGVESDGVPGQGSTFIFTLPAAVKMEQNAQHAISNTQYPIPCNP
jgi:PAS domain S-box-containing protein